MPTDGDLEGAIGVARNAHSLALANRDDTGDTSTACRKIGNGLIMDFLCNTILTEL
jgi:hypothetical protein